MMTLNISFAQLLGSRDASPIEDFRIFLEIGEVSVLL